MRHAFKFISGHRLFVTLPLLLWFGLFLAACDLAGAATTNFNWIATSPADYSVAGDWDQGTVPGGGSPGFNDVALFTNNIACNYYSNSSAVLNNDWVGQMSLGVWNNSTGTFVLNGGSILISNAPDYYAVTVGGRDGAGGAGGAGLSPSVGANSVGNFIMNGGTMTVSRSDSGYFYKDSFIVGLATNSTGTFTLNGGVANFLCGIELGIYGAGTLTVNGGAIVDNGWFGVGRGNGAPIGSGTFNLTGGAVYILPNFSGLTTGGNGGIYLNQGTTNATVNISGGSVYVVGIGFAGASYASPPQDNLNISGGSLYIGFNGIRASSSGSMSVNISGGTFHTVDMLGVGVAGGVAGSTNADLLADGTNWTWTAPSVNLTNSSFLVNGVSGPGYVTFAPEPGRTITLANVWSGVGGLTVNGPGTLSINASDNYTGNTTISQGTLALAAGGSIAGSPNIVVASGAVLAGPASGSSYTPATGQTLSNDGSPATFEGDIYTGPATVVVNYISGTPAFTVIDGVLSLSSNTVFEVNNMGPVLASGDYQVISAGTGGVVAIPGGLPEVTVTGNGTAAGEYAFLTIVNNSLYLEITTNRPPQIANVVTNTLYYGSTFQISITNLAALAGWSDPNGGPVGLSGVGPSSANGINVSSDGTNIYYNGTLTSDDYFTYTITDATLSAVGTVQLIEVLPTAAIPADAGESMSLDGTWRFYFERTNYNFGTPPNIVLPSVTQPTFQQLNYVETSGWTNLPVPGNWEMYGLSPCTYYVPDDTCGLYRYWFQVPKSWQGRRVYLYFDGVLDGAQIWLNGQPVPVNEPSWNIANYHESGWTGFQVDLTSQANFGTTNLLAVRVIKNTPSNDLDTGDYFFLGGIDRPVTLYSVPQTNIADVQVSTFITNGVATVDVLADVNNGNATPVSMLLDGVETDTTATNGTAVFSQIIDQPKLWSAEFPNLYCLTVQLKDANGQVTETVTNRIGIRQLSITNGVLLMNGVPVKFAGVGDHDSTPTNGSAIPPGFWYNELKMMKAANINAIRTCHYPYDSALYDAADELGMYVSDELPYCWCDSETPEANFEPAFVQRAQETVRRDRNHPSVVIWAIGNENTAGTNLQVVANVVHSLDPTRPRLVSTFNASQYGTELSDAHYPSLSGMQSDAANAAKTGHPFIFLENPNTWDERLGADAGMWEDWGLCMQRVWNICIASNTIPGTFPFEWSDRAVQDPNSNESYLQYENIGVQLLYYFPATGVHLLKMKGMVDAFRNRRPNLYELQMIYSPVQISNLLSVSAGQVSFPIQNRYSFTDLSYLATQWQLERSGMTIAAGNTNFEMPPLTSGDAQISLPAAALAYADTLRLDFIHPDGDDIYSYQFALSNTPPVSVITTNLPSGLPIPQFNLITQTNYNDPLYWTESIRFPATLANVVLNPANAVTLAQLNSLSATVMGGINGTQVLGTIQAGYTNNVFSYSLQWTGPSWPVQEVGWAFQMPGNYSNFSWSRDARWTSYPDYDAGRASGTDTPDTTNVDVTEMDIPDAFDFDSTKYNCYWASLTTPNGDGLRLDFSPSQLFDCRAGGTTNGEGYLLYANQQVSPANDISANIVPDLYMTLSSGNVLQGSFTVGSNSNLVSAAAGSLNGPIHVLVSPTGAFDGNQVELNFGANANAGYSVWSSTNLVTWQWDGTASQAGPGQFEFLDQLATNSPCRFYRITSP